MADPARWERKGVVFRLVERQGDGMPDEADLRAVHDVLEGAFTDHFNSAEETFDEFIHRLREDPGHRWDHWWLAEIGRGRRPAGSRPARWSAPSQRVDHRSRRVLRLLPRRPRVRPRSRRRQGPAAHDHRRRGQPRPRPRRPRGRRRLTDRCRRPLHGDGLGHEVRHRVVAQGRHASADGRRAQRSDSRSARWTPSGVSTPTNWAPFFTPIIGLSSRSSAASASSSEESRSIAAPSSPAAYAVERLEVVLAEPGDRQPCAGRGRAHEVGHPKSSAGWASSSAGVAYWASRPPVSKTATRSPIRIASSMSWVTSTTVLPSSSLQPAELVLEPAANHGVDGAERLVHQQHRRVGGERAGHADALALPAGELGAGSDRRTGRDRGRQC